MSAWFVAFFQHKHLGWSLDKVILAQTAFLAVVFNGTSA
jgi:hypothetical protein